MPTGASNPPRPLTETDRVPTLLERGSTIDVIDSLLARAYAGSGGALFIVGEAGLGKTAMLSEALSRADRFSIKIARCSELDVGLPFGLLDQLDEGSGTGEIIEAHDPREAEDARLARYALLLGWLRSDHPAPLLVAIDDLHWADPDSVGILSSACRQLANLPVAIVATLRPWPPVAIDRIIPLHLEGASLETLSPLSEQASTELFERIATAQVPVDLARRARAQCAGNPLLIGELAQVWREGSTVLDAPTVSLTNRLFLPRFVGIGTDALQWARAASIFGSRFLPTLVNSIVDLSPSRCERAVEHLHRAGLLTESSDTYAAFVHPLVRQALYDDLSPAARTALHGRTFAAMCDRGFRAVEIAPHARFAAMEGDRRAIDVLEQAGRCALAAGAVAAAVTHLTEAEALSGDTVSASLRLGLAQALLITSMVPQAEGQARQVLSDPHTPGQMKVAAFRLLSQILLASGHHDEGISYARAASQIAVRFDARLAIEILLDTAFAGWLLAGPRRAREEIDLATEMLRSLSEIDPDLLHRAATADAYLSAISGDISGVDILTDTFRRAMAQPRLAVSMSPYKWDPVLGYTLLCKHFERFEESTLGYSRLREAATKHGAHLLHQTALISDADGSWRLGRLEEAYRDLLSSTELFEMAPGIAPFCLVGLAHLTYEMGRAEESARWVAQLESTISLLSNPPYLHMWILYLRCCNRMEAADVSAARRAAFELSRVVEESGILEPCIVPWHGTAIEAHVAAGDLASAEEIINALEERCSPLPCRAPRAVATTARAIVAWRRGENDEAGVLFTEAEGLAMSVPMPLTQAEVLLTFGRFLRATGQVRPAHQHLNRALDILEGTGAARLQNRITEELRVAQGRRRRQARAVLTNQERRAASLAAEGLANNEIATKLFISPKTVEHHLGRAYAKLGIHSRRELIAEWRGRLDPGE